VCYGQGGARPTVTDADLVLGYLDPEYLLGGRLPVHADRARSALQAQVAQPLGLDAVHAAAAIVDVVNAGMAGALRVVSVERGYDPREFTLVAFGGAGPVHAARLAEELEIPRVIIPPIPGGFSALGLVMSDLRRDYARTLYTPLAGARLGDLAAAYEAMESAGRTMLREAEVPEDRWEITRSADLRYTRQAYELTVPMAEGPIAASTLARLAADFHDQHHHTYGHASEDEPIQLVNVRVTAIGKLRRLDLTRRGNGGAAVGLPRKGKSRAVYFKETGLAPCDVIPYESLGPGSERPGPVIIEAMDTTVVVPPAWQLRVDAQGFILLERRHA
jgi:N-methylhydantoinase A